jgi:hypothetical protein
MGKLCYDDKLRSTHHELRFTEYALRNKDFFVQTHTHYVMTVMLNRLAVETQEAQRTEAKADVVKELSIGPWRLPPVASRAMLVGSIIPDLLLILLTLGTVTSDWWHGRLGPPDSPAAAQSATSYLFEYRFFHDPWVKLAHNLFHAPLLVTLYLLVGYWAWRRGWRWGPALFWLAAAAALHTAIDIPIHVLDGPLIFFPFDWERRFQSTVSYWDPDYYGIPFTIAEHLIFFGLLIYLGVAWWRVRRQVDT